MTRSCADGEGLRVAVGCGMGGNEEGRLVPFGFAQGCGCAPAFGRAVGPKARRVYSTAEAVPLRWFWWEMRSPGVSGFRAFVLVDEVPA